MRALLAAAVAVLVSVELQPDQRPSPSTQTPEPLTVAAQRPRLMIPVWIEPPPKRIGVFTLVPPEHRGEMVHVSMPAGDLAMRAARAVGQAHYRRSEQKARQEVAQALKDFQASQR